MDILKLENQLCFPLYAASREVIKRYTSYLDEIGLTYTQYVAMMVLWEKKLISAKALGELLFLDSGTITPLVKRLEQNGLVTRQRSLEDERSLIITISEKGEQLKDKAQFVPIKMQGCLNLEAKESETLYRLLYKILKKDTETN